MKNYPNEKALYNSHRKYLDAMREFIFSYLEKMAPGEAEELIGLVLNRQPSDDVMAAIDFGAIPYIFVEYWDDFFKQRFGYNKQRNSEGYDIRSVTRLISECRNRGWGHPGVGDLDPEFTRACLFLITDVLEEIGKLDAKREVEDIRNNLFSDNTEKHIPDESDQLEAVKAENADLKKRLSETENRLRIVESEKAELEEHLKNAPKRPETAKVDRDKRNTEDEGSSEIKEWRREIWKQLCDYAAQKDTPVRFHKPGSENYLNVSRSLIALTGFRMQVWLGKDNREIAVRLYMSHQNFYLLGKQREEIDKEFGEPLEWEELPQRKESRVSLRKDIIDPTDESDWQNQLEWVISKLEKFHKKFNEVFLPRIQKLN